MRRAAQIEGRDWHVGQRWWRDGVLYQVYPRSWADASGDGVGDLVGITNRLDHLAWLGVDAVWLSPIYPSPMADFGYDISDHTDVDPIFGDLKDLDHLVARAHELGLRVLLDFVPNHTSDRHPWFLASRASRDNPYRSFYVWRDGDAGGGPPNNWRSRFGGGPAWSHDDTTGQWYLHSFLPEQPDLNWRNDDVRSAMSDVMRFWLERGIDGFRVDVAHRIVKDPDLRDNPPNPDWEPRMADDARLLETRSRNWPEVHEVHRLLRTTIEEFDEPLRLLAGEVNLDPPEWAAYFGDDDEFHLPFNFHSIVSMPWRPGELAALVEQVQAWTPSSSWPSWMLSNHDKSRFPTRIGRGHARAALVFLLTAPGTPVLYYGDELALSDTPIPPDRVRDPWGARVPEEGRDRARSPMPWDGTTTGGFCPPSATPWLPLGPDHAIRNVERQRQDPDSELHLVRDLLTLRRTRPSLHAGSWRTLAVTDEVLVGERRRQDEQTVVILSFAPASTSVDLDDGRWEVLRSTIAARSGTVQGAIEVGPREAVVLAPVQADDG